MVSSVSTRLVAAEGVATVFACFALLGLLATTVLWAQVGAVTVARHHAQAAADLAALAGAGGIAAGDEVGCAQAAEVAQHMAVRIGRCEIEGWDVTVTVERNVPLSMLGNRSVQAIARAGPAEDCGTNTSEDCAE